MSKFKKHIFVCENIRDGESSTPSCGMSGGIEIRAKLKSKLRELELSHEIRANASGCLGACHHGPVAVVYPEANWYGEITLDDVEEIIESDLIMNKAVKRLLIDDD